MHLRNKLNVKKIATLSKPTVYSDGGGLYLRVRKSGTKSWLYIYMLNGKRREIGLGSALDVTLAHARRKAEELRAIFVSGRDPALVRKQTRVEERLRPSFGEVADELVDSIEHGFKNEKHRKQWRSTITTYASPILTKPVDEVETANVLALLQPIWLEKSETASRVRQRIERILDAATVKGYRAGDNPARFKGNLEFLLPRRSKGEDQHHTAMPFVDLPAFMAELAKRRALAARALEFTVLTAARTGEVLGMQWQEFEAKNRLWTVPADRMKADRAHEVPLSAPAIALIEGLRTAKCEPRDKVFRNDKGHSLSNMAMLTLLRRMELPVTVHGFRSSFRDWAGETTGYDREVIEMALAHTITSKAERAYRRGNALEKRRGLMDEWAIFCLSEHGANAEGNAGEDALSI
jgi:integrase